VAENDTYYLLTSFTPIEFALLPRCTPAHRKPPPKLPRAPASMTTCLCSSRQSLTLKRSRSVSAVASDRATRLVKIHLTAPWSSPV